MSGRWGGVGSVIGRVDLGRRRISVLAGLCERCWGIHGRPRDAV